jgi:hypothetical protein
MRPTLPDHNRRRFTIRSHVATSSGATCGPHHCGGAAGRRDRAGGRGDGRARPARAQLGGPALRRPRHPTRAQGRRRRRTRRRHAATRPRPGASAVAARPRHRRAAARRSARGRLRHRVLRPQHPARGRRAPQRCATGRPAARPRHHPRRPRAASRARRRRPAPPRRAHRRRQLPPRRRRRHQARHRPRAGRSSVRRGGRQRREHQAHPRAPAPRQGGVDRLHRPARGPDRDPDLERHQRPVRSEARARQARRRRRDRDRPAGLPPHLRAGRDERAPDPGRGRAHGAQRLPPLRPAGVARAADGDRRRPGRAACDPARPAGARDLPGARGCRARAGGAAGRSPARVQRRLGREPHRPAARARARHRRRHRAGVRDRDPRPPPRPLDLRALRAQGGGG